MQENIEVWWAIGNPQKLGIFGHKTAGVFLSRYSKGFSDYELSFCMLNEVASQHLTDGIQSGNLSKYHAP